MKSEASRAAHRERCRRYRERHPDRIKARQITDGQRRRNRDQIPLRNKARDYYYANHEEQKAKNLAKYYRRKAKAESDPEFREHAQRLRKAHIATEQAKLKRITAFLREKRSAEKVCPCCGDRFFTHTTSKLYCSRRCYMNLRSQVHVNRLRVADKTGKGVTTKGWMSVLEYFNWRCAYCNKKSAKLQMEHVDPVSRGGKHVLENVVPACARCNYRKHSSSLLEFLFLRPYMIQAAKKRYRIGKNTSGGYSPPLVQTA